MVVPEIALWLALLPLISGAGAWCLRRGHPIVTAATISLCIGACVLFLKPVAQAWRLGPGVPAQLGAAFGPAAPTSVPFSFRAAIFGRTPEPVAIETMAYSGSLLLDFYRAIGRSPAPCVVVIHGGSWVSGNRKDSGTSRWLNDWLAYRGYAVASIDYRLCPQWTWPAQREDLLAAITFLREHASPLGIDPMRLVLLGRSAGSQIALATGNAVHDPSIRGIIAVYPPTDFLQAWKVSTDPGPLDHRMNLEWFLGGTPQTARAAYDSASAVTLVDGGAPPTLLLHGALDINVFPEQSQLLQAKLASAGVRHCLIMLPWAAHGFDLVDFNSPSSQIATYSIDWFLASVTR